MSIKLQKNEIEGVLKKEGFKRNLEKFQLENLQELLRLRHGMNFSVPGAGKTSVTLALHSILKNHFPEEIKNLFIVAPKNAFGSWDDEIAECYDNFNSEKMKISRLEGSEEDIIKTLSSNKK